MEPQLDIAGQYFGAMDWFTICVPVHGSALPVIDHLAKRSKMSA